ncbi:MAG: sigma-70 family RNA polymerase sigma factor [Acidobacteria bacterium]|nr:sigma-70 family RNA polymerase sigma factor [Acidobacteriota bacterium]
MSVLSQVGAPVAPQARETEFDSYFKEYRVRVFHFALQLVGNREDAMDVTQEAFLKAHRNWSTRDAGRPFGPWIYAIARNQAIDFLRKKATRREEDAELPVTASSAAGPESLAVQGELQAQVWQAINQLNPQLREALVLRDLHGFAYKEIAQITGSTAAAINSRIHDAREILRHKLRRLL